MFKFYLPLLEIFVACAMIYLIPEGLYKVAKKALGQPGNALEFLASNVRGFLIGSVVTLGFLFTFGVSYEDFAANTVRNTASDLRRFAGFDPVDRCVAQALMLGQGKTPDEVYSLALREFCKSRLDRGMANF